MTMIWSDEQPATPEQRAEGGPAILWRDRLEDSSDGPRHLIADRHALAQGDRAALDTLLEAGTPGLAKTARLTARHVAFTATGDGLSTLLGAVAPGDGFLCLAGHRVDRVGTLWATGPDVSGDYPRGTVIHGLIDDGFAPGHALFAGPGGATRILSHLVQGPVARAFSAGEIDALAAAHDEDGLVRAIADTCGIGAVDRAGDGLQWMPSAKRHASHGMQVAGLALAGSHDPVVTVQLPAEPVGTADGDGLAIPILLGIRHILDVALAASGPDPADRLPVVVTCSYGAYAGMRQRRSRVEAVAEAMLADYGPALLVLPSGNHRQAAVLGVLHDDSPSVGLVLPPDNRLPTVAVLRWREDHPPQSLAINAPDGAASPDLAGLWGWREASLDSGPVLRAVRSSRKGFAELTLTFAPTSAPAGGSTAPAGAWTVTAGFAPNASGPVELRIGRNGAIANYRTLARQSHLRDPDHRVFDLTGHLKADDAGSVSPIRRAGTVNTFARGKDGMETRHIILAGGYRAGDGQPDRHAGLGDAKGSPDCAAPSRAGAALGGVLSIGNRTGATSRLAGTSAAAPVVAARLAGLWRTLALSLPASPDAEAVLAAFATIVASEETELAADWPVAGLPDTGRDPVIGLGRLKPVTA